MSPPQKLYKPKLTTTNQPTTIRTNTQSVDTKITPIIKLIINTAISLTITCRIIQSAHNSVYPTIFILIHNLITYRTLRTNNLKSEGKKKLPWPNIHLYASITNPTEEPASTARIKWIAPRSFNNTLPGIRNQLKLTPSWSN